MKEPRVKCTSGGFLRSDRRGRRRVSADQSHVDAAAFQMCVQSSRRRRRPVDVTRTTKPTVADFTVQLLPEKRKKKRGRELTRRGNWWRAAVDTTTAAAADYGDGDDDDDGVDGVDGETDAYIDS